MYNNQKTLQRLKAFSHKFNRVELQQLNTSDKTRP